MLFFFKEKPVEFTGFVTERFQFANTLNPVVPASKIAPKWWRNVPQSSYNWENMHPDVTVRSCMGIVNTFKTGYIMPLWCDLAINFNETGIKYNFADNASRIDFHGDKQAPGWYTDYVIMKIVSPWLFHISHDIKVLYSYPWYHFAEPSPYYQPYGINDNIQGIFESHQFMLLKKEQKQVMLNAGMPLAHIIPLTERRIKFKTEVISEQEYEKKRQNIATKPAFLRRGITLRKQLK
ncbi:hypothetical protein UFOVP242_192 [uncultured Caudovirales phage]|uniref:Uncharacterized protein n=1 Tax=uncultured Caudovirales phage TaxID=2100421 RepID=A0A6J7WYP2_9CAUD|nr:hypothetical protein UFOVP242_192 [uncultured Caudovirales phage]